MFVFALRLDLLQWEERRMRLASERAYLLRLEEENDTVIENERRVEDRSGNGFNSKLARPSYGAVEQR